MRRAKRKEIAEREAKDMKKREGTRDERKRANEKRQPKKCAKTPYIVFFCNRKDHYENIYVWWTKVEEAKNPHTHTHTQTESRGGKVKFMCVFTKRAGERKKNRKEY